MQTNLILASFLDRCNIDATFQKILSVTGNQLVETKTKF